MAENVPLHSAKRHKAEHIMLGRSLQLITLLITIYETSNPAEGTLDGT